MTPKEKAHGLYSLYKSYLPSSLEPDLFNALAKKFALICVDEIQNHAQMVEGEYEGFSSTYQYFVKVRKHIIEM